MKNLWLIFVAIVAAFCIASAFPSEAQSTRKYKVVHQFKGGTDGLTPIGSVIFDATGNLYGTTVWGGGGSTVLQQRLWGGL